MSLHTEVQNVFEKKFQCLISMQSMQEFLEYLNTFMGKLGVWVSLNFYF